MGSDAVDPQQRLLLEAVYDSLRTAGLPMENLRGPSTAVYVDMMRDDWSTMVLSDVETLPTYTATGLARSYSQRYQHAGIYQPGRADAHVLRKWTGSWAK
ncbi:hypothetical protein N7476_002887 [Penicillium atrosanguineum]|uniref:Beta-ketoacyl synthase-like N-terminal domain-containing protein n=2 Tax=Penicillium atrosanguineum TaxID=1132637 RepID=A0A9W9U8L7_9EURO|nr:hypothetical protein N7476_002887 [Penicillium atrosanguineum]